MEQEQQALSFYMAVNPVLQGDLNAAIRASVEFKLCDAYDAGNYLAELVRQRCENVGQFDIVGLVYDEALDNLIKDLEQNKFDDMQFVYNDISVYPNAMATDFDYKPEKLDEFKKTLTEHIKENGKLKLSDTSIEVLNRLGIDLKAKIA